MKSHLKLLVVDGHGLFVETTKILLLKLADNVEIVHANDGATALEMVKKNHTLELILLDLNLPDKHGADILKKIMQNYPRLPIVALTGSSNVDAPITVVDGDTKAHKYNSSANNIMFDTIQLMLGRNVSESKGISSSSGARCNQGQNVYSSLESLAPQDKAKKLGLTPRQFDVVCCLLSGKSNKVIGNDLHVSEHTVKAHVANIFQAMAIGNRSQIPLALEKMGWDIRQLAR